MYEERDNVCSSQIEIMKANYTRDTEGCISYGYTTPSFYKTVISADRSCYQYIWATSEWSTCILYEDLSKMYHKSHNIALHTFLVNNIYRSTGSCGIHIRDLYCLDLRGKKTTIIDEISNTPISLVSTTHCNPIFRPITVKLCKEGSC